MTTMMNIDADDATNKHTMPD